MRIGPFVVVCVLAGVAAVAQAGGQTCKGTPARLEGDFVALGNGDQLHDRKTGLIWARCIESQSWKGSTCAADDPNAVNPGPNVSYAQAQKLAASKASAQEAWRIPTKAELLSLREPGCYNPSLNLRLFPTQPAWSSDGSFWTSTREGEGVSVVSAIGNSDAWSRTEESKTNHVRLVRSAPKKSP